MNPSLRNLFMKKLTRDRVVPTISASVSCDSFGTHVLRLVFLAVARQQQQRPGQPLLARVEQLIDQVFLDADVAREHVRRGSDRRAPARSWSICDHLRLLDDEHGRLASSPSPSPSGAADRRDSLRRRSRRRSSIATMASLPVFESTEILMLPCWMYITCTAGSPWRDDHGRLGVFRNRARKTGRSLRNPGD